MPQVKRLLYVTQDPQGDSRVVSLLAKISGEVELLAKPHHAHRPRIDAMLQCPHEEAIFLDGDRLLLDDVTELFDVLQSFDLALAAAPQVLNAPTVAAGIYELLPAVSAGAPEWNGGVIVVRMTAALRRFVAD